MTDLEKRAAQMKWDPPPPGSEARKEMPASAFLMPSSRKYPYKIKVDDQWVVSIPALRSVISVANSQGDAEISAKASSLLKKLQEDEAEHSDVDTVLAHFGVKGMKWGQRKSERKEARTERKAAIKEIKRRSESQKTQRQKENESVWGKKGAARIEYDITTKGRSRKKAEAAEFGRHMIKSTALTLGSVAAFTIWNYSPAIKAATINSVHKAKAAAGQRAATKILPRIGEGKIIDMKQAASGAWKIAGIRR